MMQLWFELYNRIPVKDSEGVVSALEDALENCVVRYLPEKPDTWVFEVWFPPV